MTSEFDVIRHYFQQVADGIPLGVGDDGALLDIAPGHQLVTSADLLLEGRHFLADTPPETLGHKALAVNLSDLAAMGAAPLACLLSLGLPQVDDDWLQKFSSGFHALAKIAACPLVGGDTTRSEHGLVIGVTVMGTVPRDTALRRDAAQINDDVWLTGTLGAAYVALQALWGKQVASVADREPLMAHLQCPQPPIFFAPQLRGIAHAAIDISDGLMQDLGHLLTASDKGAEIDYQALPSHPAIRQLPAAPLAEALLAGGDVYQLCFTAPEAHRNTIAKLAKQHQVQVSCIGRVTQKKGIAIKHLPHPNLIPAQLGFDHFLD